MVKVNQKQFKTYDLDTLETFKTRLASLNGSLSEYLYFPDGVTYKDIMDSEKNIICVDMLKKIKTSARSNSSISELLEETKNNFTSRFAIRDRVVHIWMAYNDNLQKLYNQVGRSVLDTVSKELVKNNVYISEIQVHNDWKDRDRYKKYLTETIKSRQEQINKTLILFRRYDGIETPITYTNLEIEKMDFILTLGLKDISLLELFNSVVVTPLVPVVIVNDFYKILKDFIPSDENMWFESDENSLTL